MLPHHVACGQPLLMYEIRWTGRERLGFCRILDLGVDAKGGRRTSPVEAGAEIINVDD